MISTQFQNVKTGDVLLFSNNTPTGFLLRTFVSSEWNHSGIAVRFISSDEGKRVSLNEDGDLYILETNTGIRPDEIFGMNVVGAGFSRADRIFHKYNRIAVRRLHDTFRTPEFADRTIEFAELNRGNRFPTTSLPFISVWLGIPLKNKSPSTEPQEMFCSELMAHYYGYVLGPVYQRMAGEDLKLSNLFGVNSPPSEDMFTPGHYASSRTPNAIIFKGTEEIIYTAYADMLYVILQPLLIALVVVLAIWMSLPRDSLRNRP